MNFESSTSPEMMARRKKKLQQLTGRHQSIVQIEPFLNASNEEEATRNAQMIHKSDQIKKISGSRPSAYQVDDDKGENAHKINVLNKKFGDEQKVESVLPYVLNVDGEEDAVEKGKQLRSMEKAHKRMGEN